MDKDKRIEEFEAEVLEREIPKFMDPSTNNGDWRHDAEFRMGWNACRDALAQRANQLRQQCLATHDAEVIERCASMAEEWGARYLAKAMRQDINNQLRQQAKESNSDN